MSPRDVHHGGEALPARPIQPLVFRTGVRQQKNTRPRTNDTCVRGNGTCLYVLADVCISLRSVLRYYYQPVGFIRLVVPSLDSASDGVRRG